jgi:thiol-disulfide isomerase/thioredoxin
MKKNTLIIIITAALALAAGVLSHLPKPPEVSESTLLATQLPDLSGKLHSLKEWQGKILIINFWATWCPPCLEEIPAFMALQKQYANKNVQFVGIAIDDNAAVAAYNAQANMNYPVLIAENSGIEISKPWGNVISSVPFTVILNPQGKIIYRSVGELSRENVLEVITPFLDRHLAK